MAERPMLWMFNYKKGPAPMTGCVEASTEALAYEVMTAWAAKSGVLALGGLRPMILADESILITVPIFAEAGKQG